MLTKASKERIVYRWVSGFGKNYLNIIMESIDS